MPTLHGAAPGARRHRPCWTAIEKSAPPAAVYAKPVSTRLNPTGRVITMSVPLKEDGADLGEIVVRIDPDDAVLVPKAALVDKMTPLLTQGDLERLHSISESNGQVSLAELAQAGFNLRFDPAQLTLVFEPQVDQRATGTISVGRQLGPLVSPNAAPPALLSGYLNIAAGAEQNWGTTQPLGGFGVGRTSASLDVEGVLRFYNVVFENEMTFDGNVDSTDCAVSSTCTDQQSSGLKRRSTRVVYDIPDWTMRIAGRRRGGARHRLPEYARHSRDRHREIATQAAPRREHASRPARARSASSAPPTWRSSSTARSCSACACAPATTICPTCRSARAPTRSSSSSPTTRARSARWRSRHSSTATSWQKATPSGRVSGGFPSYFDDNNRAYYFDQQFGTAFFRYGLTDAMTGEAHIQADSQVLHGRPDALDRDAVRLSRDAGRRQREPADGRRLRRQPQLRPR